MLRKILFALVAFFVFSGVAHAGGCAIPNPNLIAGDGVHLFADNCSLPAVSLNRLTNPANVVNTVIQLGADPTGVADSAPACRAAAALASNHVIYWPPGTYLFSSTTSSGYTVLDPANCRITGQSNFAWIMYGATFNVATTNRTSCFTGVFQFDSVKDFTVSGGTINGCRTGFAVTDVNEGIAVMSGVHFALRDQKFNGFGGTGAPYIGDWWVDAEVDNGECNGVGKCFDIAFLKNVTLSNNHASGGDNVGGTTVGQAFFSDIYDTPNVNNNFTGVSFTDTDGVTLIGNSATNFLDAVLLQSGKNYKIIGNNFYQNPGCPTLIPSLCATLGATQGGFGIVIQWLSAFSSTVPVSNVTIVGNTITNNGNATIAGEGILIDAQPIINAGQNYKFNNIVIDNNILDSNYTTGVDADGVSQIVGLTARDNMCSGAVQTGCLGPTLITTPAVAPSAPTFYTNFTNPGGFQITSGFPFFVGGLPTVSSGAGDCGTAPSIFGSNSLGRVSVGTGANGGVCTVTFSGTPNLTTNPVCFVNNASSAARTVFAQETLTSVRIVATSTLSPGDDLTFKCEGYK